MGFLSKWGGGRNIQPELRAFKQLFYKPVLTLIWTFSRKGEERFGTQTYLDLNCIYVFMYLVKVDDTKTTLKSLLPVMSSWRWFVLIQMLFKTMFSSQSLLFQFRLCWNFCSIIQNPEWTSKKRELTLGEAYSKGGLFRGFMVDILERITKRGINWRSRCSLGKVVYLVLY